MKFSFHRQKQQIQEPERVFPDVNYENLQRFQNEFKEFMEQNDRVICVKQVEFRQCYDSTWEITMLLGSQIMTRQIVRRDTESHLRLAKILQDIDTLEALLALDERANIYYD